MPKVPKFQPTPEFGQFGERPETYGPVPTEPFPLSDLSEKGRANYDENAAARTRYVPNIDPRRGPTFGRGAHPAGLQQNDSFKSNRTAPEYSQYGQTCGQPYGGSVGGQSAYSAYSAQSAPDSSGYSGSAANANGQSSYSLMKRPNSNNSNSSVPADRDRDRAKYLNVQVSSKPSQPALSEVNENSAENENDYEEQAELQRDSAVEPENDYEDPERCASRSQPGRAPLSSTVRATPQTQTPFAPAQTRTEVHSELTEEEEGDYLEPSRPTDVPLRLKQLRERTAESSRGSSAYESPVKAPARLPPLPPLPAGKPSAPLSAPRDDDFLCLGTAPLPPGAPSVPPKPTDSLLSGKKLGVAQGSGPSRPPLPPKTVSPSNVSARMQGPSLADPQQRRPVVDQKLSSQYPLPASSSASRPPAQSAQPGQPQGRTEPNAQQTRPTVGQSTYV